MNTIILLWVILLLLLFIYSFFYKTQQSLKKHFIEKLDEMNFIYTKKLYELKWSIDQFNKYGDILFHPKYKKEMLGLYSYSITAIISVYKEFKKDYDYLLSLSMHDQSFNPLSGYYEQMIDFSQKLLVIKHILMLTCIILTISIVALGVFNFMF